MDTWFRLIKFIQTRECPLGDLSSEPGRHWVGESVVVVAKWLSKRETETVVLPADTSQQLGAKS